MTGRPATRAKIKSDLYDYDHIIKGLNNSCNFFNHLADKASLHLFAEEDLAIEIPALLSLLKRSYGTQV